MGAQMTETKLIPFSSDVKLDYQGRTIEGYAAAFGNIDLVNDIIHPHAFAKTLVERGGKVKFLWQHDPKQPLGRILEMSEDGKGLFMKAIISDTQVGRDALALLKDGAIEGLSIGYDPIVHDYSKTARRVCGYIRRRFGKAEGTRAERLEAIYPDMEKDLEIKPKKQGKDAQPGEGSEPETKSGRIIAKRNAERVKAIRKLLQELIEDGGLELEDEQETEAPAKTRAAEDKPSTDGKPAKAEAGPDTSTVAPPTINLQALALEIESETLRLLEV
jgi:HK97 family phage prohead protease